MAESEQPLGVSTSGKQTFAFGNCQQQIAVAAAEEIIGKVLAEDAERSLDRCLYGLLFHQMLHGVDIQPPSSRHSKSIGHQHVLEPDLRTKRARMILRSIC